jgi:hypothetical protein
VISYIYLSLKNKFMDALEIDVANKSSRESSSVLHLLNEVSGKVVDLDP